MFSPCSIMFDECVHPIPSCLMNVFTLFHHVLFDECVHPVPSCLMTVFILCVDCPRISLPHHGSAGVLLPLRSAAKRLQLCLQGYGWGPLDHCHQCVSARTNRPSLPSVLRSVRNETPFPANRQTMSTKVCCVL